ncbi:enoyl-CoA hydratase/isomerase family protein [Mycobacterium genavense]|uniref:enoyl-CoA hydratase/isomerase family protein n=1 Tax=Mycobacterium genavense TaxID=36812 RepID=UPI0004B7E8B3|nr:enoyl-CoA hydratase-related protein [Mycobacterium genavense]
MPDNALEEAGSRLVDDMLRVAPLALRKTKETLNRAIGILDLKSVLDLEQATQLECIQGGDFQEGLRAFIERRSPRFGSEQDR